MLSQAGAPAIARSAGRLHRVNALWRASKLSALCRYLDAGRRDVYGWAEDSLAKVAEFQAEPGAIDPFLNVNTQADLALAARLLAKL